MLKKKDIKLRESKRDSLDSKDYTGKKLIKKIAEAFRKINRRDCYEFFNDEKSATHYNLDEFLVLLYKGLKSKYGKSSKYKKREVLELLLDIFPDPTEIQATTFEAINKHIKKYEHGYVEAYHFTGLFPGKCFFRAVDEVYAEYEQA